MALGAITIGHGEADLASERDVNAAAPADPISQRVDVTAADFPAP